MSAYTITTTQTLVTQYCYKCHVLFAMPGDLRDNALADHSISFWCPNGHGQHYTGKTAEQEAIERRDEIARQLASRDEDLRAERMAHATTKGQLTKTRNRAEKGVCLHCHRSFVNVARHVETRHPAVARG